MTLIQKEIILFKRAVILSLAVHIILALLLILSPELPFGKKKGMIHYVNVISMGGGGGGESGGSLTGGGGGGKEIEETSVSRRETLRDLTTPQDLEQTPVSSLRHPTEKPEKEKTPRPEKKKTAIQKQSEPTDRDSSSSSTGTSGTGEGSGSGVRLGIGEGPGGGFGSGFSSQIGMSTFPFTYYLQIIVDRISSNWLKSQLSGSLSKGLHTTVYFKIFSSGQISDVKIEESSGINALDLSALRAVHS
ncbi:MAG: TonB C-terminal domain-containing protein, partial [Acidobacteriota bacterium]